MRISSITIDVEDGVSIAMRDAFGITTNQTDRVVRYTDQILELLAKHEVKATFFVLGVVAEKFPLLVRRIAKENHELGIHGFNHIRFDKMDPGLAYHELDSAKKIVEDISGNKVFGHRAPAFSIMPETSWGLDVIAETGFKYDSSIMPCRTSQYGWKHFKKNLHYLQTPKGYSLIEVPLTTGTFFKRTFPVGGGSYLRLMPFHFTKYLLQRNNNARPNVVYIHPYELDVTPYPEYYFEHLAKAGLVKQLKMRSFWVNRKSVYQKLERLLSDFSFKPLKNVIEDTLNVSLN